MTPSELETPGFSKGRSIILSDGQSWTFPKANRMIVPTFGDEGITNLKLRPGYGKVIDEFVAPLRAREGLALGSFMEIILSAAATLLKRNYRLEQDDLTQLLVFNLDNTSSGQSWVDLQNLFTIVVDEDAPDAEPDSDETPAA